MALTYRLAFLAVTILALAPAPLTKDPLRPPDGIYTYSLFDGKGPPAFTSLIHVRSNGSTFVVSETVKLPGGQMAMTESVWSCATLLPESFDVRQGKIRLHSFISRDKVTLTGRARPFLRIAHSIAILPSVGLISTDLMFAYFLLAHPSDAATLAEIQNDQTVTVRQGGSPVTLAGQSGHALLIMSKQQKHGVSGDLERIVGALDRRSDIFDSFIVTPGDARIVLVHYSPSVEARRNE